MIVFLFGSGFRRFSSGMPVISSNSIAISAACHLSRDENGDETLKPLKYGALSGPAHGVQTTGFSASDVKPLRNGDVYVGSPNLSYNTTQMCLEYIAFRKLLLSDQFHIFTMSLVQRGDQIKSTESYPKLWSRSEDRTSLYSATAPLQWMLPVRTQLAIIAANLHSATITEDEYGARHRRLPHLDARDVRKFLRHLDRHRMRIMRKCDSSTRLLLNMIESSVRAPNPCTAQFEELRSGDLPSSVFEDSPLQGLLRKDQNVSIHRHQKLEIQQARLLQDLLEQIRL